MVNPKLIKRCCEAVVLAYKPTSSSRHYIPSVWQVESSLDYAVKIVLGVDPANFVLGAELLLLGEINLREDFQISPQIRDGVGYLLGNIRNEEGSPLFHFLRGATPVKFAYNFLREEPLLSRFAGRGRERAARDFRAYWTPEQRAVWREIHYATRENSSSKVNF